MSTPLSPGEVPTTVLHALGDGACRTLDQLFDVLPLNRRQISNGAASLIYRGYLERQEVGCYRLTTTGLAAAASGEVLTSGPIRADRAAIRAPRNDTLRQRAWNAMRMSGTFTIGDIVMAAAAPGDVNPQNGVQRYLHALKLAGYVVELPVRKRGTRLTSNGYKRFRLLTDTGPIAPAVRARRATVHDHNTGEDVPCAKTP